MQSRYDMPRQRYRHNKKVEVRKVEGSLTAFRLLACLVLLGFTILMRLFLPGATSTLQDALLPHMETNRDYHAVIATLGETLSSEEPFFGVLDGLYVLAFGSARDSDSVYVANYPQNPYPEMPDEGTIVMEVAPPPIEEVFPAIVFPDGIAQARDEEEYPEERETPEAVAVFHARQESFASFALPENVSLSYQALPFAHQSPITGFVSSSFGFRNHPIAREVRFHFGTDIGVYTGTPFYAFADAYVVSARNDEGWGKNILLYHGDGIYTRYAHAHVLYVSAGQRVEKGETIGRAGQSGAATGPHLHFELIVDGLFRNPEFYLDFIS